MPATRLLTALAILALAGAPMTLSGCFLFMKKAENAADQAIDRTPEPPRVDGKLVYTGTQHDTWLDVAVKPLSAWNFDAAPFRQVRNDSTISAVEAVWTIMGENKAGRVTQLVIRLGDPDLAVGKHFNVGDPGGMVEPPLATVELRQAVRPLDMSAWRVWRAAPRAQAIDVGEVGPGERRLLNLDLVFSPAAGQANGATGTFGLKGNVTIYGMRPVEAKH